MRIVLCDDHLLLLESMATALGRLGYTIEAACTTPEAAVTAVAAHAPDVLLIDIVFPESSGLDAAAQVRRDNPRTKVVMMTGSVSAGVISRAMSIGVSGFAMKGQRIEEIVRIIDRAVKGEEAFDGRQLAGAVAATPVPPERRTPLHTLTRRERDVLDLLATGLDTLAIQRDLGVSQSTVRTHVQSILCKLGVHSRLQAVALLSLDPVWAVEGSRADGV